jgi:hypothetical protein
MLPKRITHKDFPCTYPFTSYHFGKPNLEVTTMVDFFRKNKGKVQGTLGFLLLAIVLYWALEGRHDVKDGSGPNPTPAPQVEAAGGK